MKITHDARILVARSRFLRIYNCLVAFAALGNRFAHSVFEFAASLWSATASLWLQSEKSKSKAYGYTVGGQN